MGEPASLLAEGSESLVALREKAHALETVNRIGMLLAAELDLEKLVQALTDAATEVAGAEFGAFFYNAISAAGESYVLYTLSGVPREAFSKFPMPRNTDLFGPTFRGEAPIRIANVRLDPRYGKHAPYHGMPDGHLPVCSYLAVPVASRSGEVIGGLFFGHSQIGVFSDTAERIMVGIAAQAAIAFDNARLYASAQRELSERRRVEAELRASEERFRQLADSMPQIVWTARPDGHVDYFNKRWFELAGQLPDLSGDDSWKHVLHPDDVQSSTNRWYHSVRSGEIYELEYRFKVGGTGTYRWHLGRAVPIRDEAGQIVRWFGTSTDIDDYKRAQQQRDDLLASERAARSEAERVGQLKDEFLATLSHELRTPLHSILGWSQLLQAHSVDATELREGLEIIERSARSQSQIIDDLLDMSRIISGKLRLDVQRVDLPSVIEAAIETVQPAAEARGIRLVKVIDPLASPVTGDPSRLQQVIWNLLSNAIKFTPRGGQVQVTLERVNSHVEISVTDNGQGIRPDFLPHVFERFRQEDSSTTRRHGGLGLGLSIVKHLVEMHGGAVRAKSPGERKGATFIVALPMPAANFDPGEVPARRGGGASTSIAWSAPDLSGVTVLVVDDDPDSRSLLKRLLAGEGAQVLTADSAAAAFAILRSEHPTILVSDIGMPGEDGLSLIQRIRALPQGEGGRTPAVALTAFARTEDRTRALIAGYQMHLAKPVEPTELLAVVDSLVRFDQSRDGHRS